MSYVRKYDPPHGEYVAGVPARDLPESEWNDLPAALRELAQPFYRRESTSTARIVEVPEPVEPAVPDEEVSDAGE